MKANAGGSAINREFALRTSWFSESLYCACRKRRWLKRLLKTQLPDFALVKLKGMQIAIDPRDERGPSFHVSFGGEAAFSNYEVPQKQEILAWLPRQGGVYVDVGANIGPIAFWLKREIPDLTIFAFEAHPRQAELFHKTILVNLWRDIQIEAVAVGRESGEATLYLDRSDAGGNSLLPETISRKASALQCVRAPMVSLDEYFALSARKMQQLDVLKLDVQGAENDVLWGAEAILRRFTPVILIEGENRRIVELQELVQPLQTFALDYCVRQLEGNDWYELQDLPEIAARELAQGRIFSDYVFVPRSRRSTN